MWDRAFLRRLRRELPRWVEQGWVEPRHQQVILDHIAAGAGGARRAPFAVAVMGVLLFGAGVITFFAANWEVMPKAVKLAVLFGAMWLAYAGAGWFLARAVPLERRFGQALLLLGVILFGANIHLIAQIYHIEGHYPNAVLLWTLGALAAVYIVPAQPVAVAGLALAVLWSSMETVLNFGGPGRFYGPFLVHWPFLVVWALFLPPIYRQAWRLGATAATLALFAWAWINLLYLSVEQEVAPIDLLRVYFLVGLGVFVLGVIMERAAKLIAYSLTVQRLAILATLLSFYGLTISGLHGLGTNLLDLGRAPSGPVSVQWTVGTLSAMAGVVALAAWHWYRFGETDSAGYVRWGQILLAVILAVLAANLFVPAGATAATVFYISFNALYLASLVWLIYAGYHRNEAFRVNVGFAFFAVGLLTLYFDRFWTLMDRSFFFMGAGLLLFGGGYLIERQRRRLIGGMSGAADEGETR